MSNSGLPAVSAFDMWSVSCSSSWEENDKVQETNTDVVYSHYLLLDILSWPLLKEPLLLFL